MSIGQSIGSSLGRAIGSSLSAGGWSPLSLFQSSEAGLVYDAMDAGSFYSDDALTTQCVVNATCGSQRDARGLHKRYQSTAANRPILRGTPTGSNLVSNSGLDSEVGWIAGSNWIIGSGVATATASSFTLTSTLAATSSRVYLVRYTMTRSAGTLTPSFGGVTLTARSVSGTYEEFVTASSAATLVFTGAAFSGTLDDVSVIDYSADVVTAPYALQMGTVAGVDRWMQTAAVDFGATDELTVCWGVRKHSDAAQGCVVELTASVAANNGSWLLAAPDGATATFAFDSKGTVQIDAVASGNTAPMAAVLTGLSDISGDSCTLRVNGAAGDTDAGDQGTGNYSNAALYFGKRAGTSLPFLGLDYGGVIRGALTTTELTSLERWVSARTPGTTIA